MNFAEIQAKILNILTQEKATADDVAEIMKSANVTGAVEFSSPENDAAIERLLASTLSHKNWSKWA